MALPITLTSGCSKVSKEFQGDNGLEKDGLMKPDGPTIGSLNSALLGMTKTKHQPEMFSITDEIGRNRKNNQLDVLSTRQALSILKRSPRSKTENELRADNGLFGALERFQQSAKLKVDGWMRPGGETESELNQLSTSLIQRANLTSVQSKAAKRKSGPEQVAAVFISPSVYFSQCLFLPLFMPLQNILRFRLSLPGHGGEQCLRKNARKSMIKLVLQGQTIMTSRMKMIAITFTTR